MGKLSLVEKIKYAYSHGEEMPLKGHVRLVLEDIRDGSQIVEEGDNLITNAVASIFSKNWCGLANFASLLPLKSFYGGCLLFQNQMSTATADDFDLPNELVNPLIAHAGDEAPASGWTSKKRGSPVFPDFVETDTSIKMVWLWDNTQGNGTIGTVSLCPSVLGNMSMTPSNPTYNPMKAFGGDTNSNSTWSEEISKQYPWSIDDAGKTARTIWVDGTTFKEYVIRHDYLAFGIMRNARTWQEVDVRSATIRTVDNACFVFDDANYYYVAKATSATALRIDKISKLTFEVTQADITYDGTTFYVGNISGALRRGMRVFAFDGTYLYYPNSTRTTFYKLNLSDNSDKTELDGTINVPIGSPIGSSGNQFVEPQVLSSGLVLGSNYIINGNSNYAIAECKNIFTSGYNANQAFLVMQRKGASCYVNGKQTYSSSSLSAGQGNATTNMFLSSIYTLPESKVKSTSQTMRLEYTLTEQT